VTTHNTSAGTIHNHYFRTNIPDQVSLPSQSFELTWDIMPSRIDATSGIDFGVWGTEQIDAEYPGEGNAIWAVPGAGYGDKTWTLFSKTPQGLRFAAYDGILLDTWYRSRLRYDATANIITNDLYSLSSGSPVLVTTLTITDTNTFTENFAYLGIVRTETVRSDELPGIAAGLIDNVCLDVVPEPSNFVLLIAGVISLIAYVWRRRRHTA
jgi:hypothetical protein